MPNTGCLDAHKLYVWKFMILYNYLNKVKESKRLCYNFHSV